MTREEAIKELKEDIELYIPLHGTIDDVDRDLPDGRLITALEMGIKALEQEPKTGHWKYVQYDSDPNIGNWHCSECNGICTEMHSIGAAYNYCPNCGAKMEDKE